MQQFVVTRNHAVALDTAFRVLSHTTYENAGSIQIIIHPQDYSRTVSFLGQPGQESEYWHRLLNLYYVGLSVQELLEEVRGKALGPLDEKLVMSSVDAFARRRYGSVPNQEEF